jgi:hypothetical protein
LKPWVKSAHLSGRNSEGVATGLRLDDGDATLSGLRLQKHSDAFFPGLPKLLSVKTGLTISYHDIVDTLILITSPAAVIS